MAKRKLKSEQPKVHPDLQGFDVDINSFGEVKISYDIDKLNEFLTRNVKDKKFKERDDIQGPKETDPKETGDDRKAEE